MVFSRSTSTISVSKTHIRGITHPGVHKTTSTGHERRALSVDRMAEWGRDGDSIRKMC